MIETPDLSAFGATSAEALAGTERLAEILRSGGQTLQPVDIDLIENQHTG